MATVHRPVLYLVFLVGASVFGLFAVLLFVFNQSVYTDNVAWRKPLVGSIFLLLCATGGVAALSPVKCSVTVGHQKNRSRDSQAVAEGSGLIFRGHHPDCAGFSMHVLNVGGHVFCAACAGLFAGALISLALVVVYFFFGLGFGEIALPAVVLGDAGVMVGFLQLKSRGIVRAVLNALFVLGAFFFLRGIDELARSAVIDAFAIALIILWLVTRITLSEWDHARICRLCSRRCEALLSANKLSVSAPESINGAHNN